MTTDLADMAIEMVLKYNLMSMHLIANEEFVTAKEGSYRGGNDIKKEARGRLAALMIIH